jgi:diacylglycerol kinase
MRYAVKIYKSIRNALRGIRYAYRHELSFRMEVWAGLVFVVVGFLFWPLSAFEISLMVLAYTLVLAFELVNTALERMFERLHPEHHELIGISKDLASSAVFVAVLFSCFEVVLIVMMHAWSL